MTQIEWYMNSLKKEMQEKYGRVFKLYDIRYSKPQDMEKIRRNYRKAGKRFGIRLHIKRIGNKTIISTKNYKGYKYITEYMDTGCRVWKINTLVKQ